LKTTLNSAQPQYYDICKKPVVMRKDTEILHGLVVRLVARLVRTICSWHYGGYRAGIQKLTRYASGLATIGMLLTPCACSTLAAAVLCTCQASLRGIATCLWHASQQCAHGQYLAGWQQARPANFEREMQQQWLRQAIAPTVTEMAGMSTAAGRDGLQQSVDC
jgi:hypothetical protein